MPSGICCAQCCTIFSFAGFVYLLSVYGLMKNQRTYIKGIGDEAQKSPVLEGAIVYLVLSAFCCTYWIYYNKTKPVDDDEDNEDEVDLPNKINTSSIQDYDPIIASQSPP